MPKFRTLLRNKNFILYSIGQAFSQFADRLVFIILIGFVYKRWPGSTFQLAKLLFFTVIPAFVISPIAGVYIDRWNKKYVLIASDLFRGTMILLVPLFFIYNENITPVCAIIFLIFAAACFFLPARLSIIPNLVTRENLLIANSASSITWVISGILGFSFGGILAEWVGIKNSLYINSVIYFLSAGSFLILARALRTEKSSLSQTESRPAIEAVLKKSFLEDLKKGFRTLFFDKKIKSVACILFILASVTGAVYVVAIVFVQEVLHTMTKDIGILSMCLFLGVLLGAYLYGKLGARLPRAKTMLMSLFFTGVFVNVFAVGLKVTGSFWFGSASMFLLGFFIAPIYVTANTTVHESIESDLRGRVFSSLGIVINLGFLLFMILSSVIAEHIEKFWILVICGSIIAILGLVSIPTRFFEKLTSS